jgi:DNA-binding transcriptional ArsR family regulator
VEDEPGQQCETVRPLPDLRPLGLPATEDALLRLVLITGEVRTGDAAQRLGVSGAQVSRAAAALKDRGLLRAAFPGNRSMVLAPLDDALAALVEERRRRAEEQVDELERLRDELLAVARWQPPARSPHTVLPGDLREWERIVRLREVRRSLDVVVDRHHVNTHVPPTLLREARGWRHARIRLLVSGTDDPRPMLLTAGATDLDAARVGVQVRRSPERSAAFSVYDGRRLELPLWQVQRSGWSDEPGEVRAAGVLFEALWEAARPWPGPAVPDNRDGVQRDRAIWHDEPVPGRGVVGSAP